MQPVMEKPLLSIVMFSFLFIYETCGQTIRVPGVFNFSISLNTTTSGTVTSSATGTIPTVATSPLPLTTNQFTVSSITDVAQTQANSTLDSIIINSSTANYPVPNVDVVTISPVDLVTTPPLVSAVVNNPIEKYEGFAECICDLIVDSCDVNCCCDPDCTTYDLEPFPSCSKKSGTVQSRNDVCVSTGLLLWNNSAIPTYQRTPSLLCLVYDNNPQRLFYGDPEVVTNISLFDQPWIIRDLTSPILSAVTNVNGTSGSSDSFKIGMPVLVLAGAERSLSRFRLPAMSAFSERCASYIEILFLNDAQSSCSHAITDLPDQCLLSPFLDMTQYLNISVVSSAGGLSFLKSTMQDTAQITDIEAESISLPVHLTSVSIQDFVGNIQPQSFDPSHLSPYLLVFHPSNQTCANVIREIHYSIFHNASTINLVEAEVVLSSVSTTNRSVHQIFSVRFLSIDSPGNEVVRSGNPGYLDGLPLLVAFVNDTMKAEEENMTASHFSLPTLDSSGSCQTDVGQTVLFGENVQMSCLLYIDISDPSTACQNVTAQLRKILGSQATTPTYVSVYGNETTFRMEAWLQITWSLPESEAVFTSPNLCRNVIYGMSLEVVYSKVGFLESPQSKITGMLLRYLDQDVVLEFAVSFVDFSNPAADLRGLQLPVYRLLPSDFFSPL